METDEDWPICNPLHPSNREPPTQRQDSYLRSKYQNRFDPKCITGVCIET